MLISGLLVLGVCLGALGVAFLAASEISLAVSDKLVFLDREEKQEPGILTLLQILSHPERISHSLLAGTVLSAGMSAVFLAFLMRRLLPDGPLVGAILVLLCLFLPLLVLFGEVLPRVYFFQRAEETAIRIARPLSFTIALLKPLVDVSLGIHRMVQGLAGRRGKERSPFVEEEDLEWIRCFAEGTETLRKEEIRIIRKIVDFNEIRVQDILVPMGHVISLNAEAKVSQAMELIVQSGYSRLPVYKGDPSRIVGVLHALDLFRVSSLTSKVAECDRKPLFVQSSELIRDLFKAMQKRGVMMAVVTDAQGAGQGIVTMEDMLEEIFGEIEDEYDLKDQRFREIGEREYLVDAGIDVQELNQQLHLGIPTDGYKTLSGYIQRHLRRIPQEGERFTIGNLLFKIELADEKRIYKLFLRQMQPR